MSQIYKEAPSPSKAEMGSLDDLDTSTKTSIVGAVNEINGKLVNATSAEAGLMSASDKSKLDGIATGATANVVSDSLIDTSTTNALSAAKGKELNDSITSLNSNLQNLIKTASYTLTEQITIGAHSSKDFSLDIFGIPSSANILGGVIYTYNDAYAQELIVYSSIWYNSKYLRVGNFSNNACTINSGRIIYVYYF